MPSATVAGFAQKLPYPLDLDHDEDKPLGCITNLENPGLP